MTDSVARILRALPGVTDLHMPTLDTNEIQPGEFKRNEIGKGAFYYRQQLYANGDRQRVYVNLGRVRVLFAAMRTQPAFEEGGEERTTVTFGVVLEGDSTARTQGLDAIQVRLRDGLRDAIATYRAENKKADSRLTGIQEQLHLLDRSRCTDEADRSPMFFVDSVDWPCSSRPRLVHLSEERKTYRVLRDSLPEVLAPIRFTHENERTNEMEQRFRSFSMNATVCLQHVNVTATGKPSVKLILREALLDLDTLVTSTPSTARRDTVLSYFSDTLLSRPGEEDAITKIGSEEAARLRAQSEEYQTIIDPSSGDVGGLELSADRFWTEFAEDPAKKKQRVGADKMIGMEPKTRFRMRCGGNRRLVLVMRGPGLRVDFNPTLRVFEPNNQQSSLLLKGMCLDMLSDRLRTLLRQVLTENESVFPGAKGKAYFGKLEGAVDQFNLVHPEYKNVSIEVAERPGARAFATTRCLLLGETGGEEDLLPVGAFIEGLITPFEFSGVAVELESMVYGHGRWTAQLSAKEVRVASVAHMTGEAPCIPSGFVMETESDILSPLTRQGAIDTRLFPESMSQVEMED